MLAAVQRHILDGAQVEERHLKRDGVVLYARGLRYEIRPADWLVADADWVDEAIRVVADGGAENYVLSYGLIFPVEGAELLLNDVATMRELGRRLGADLDPLAYAELLAEFYSGRDIGGSRVLASSATGLHPPGELVRDPLSVVAEHPGVDPVLLSAPVVHPTDAGSAVDFQSCHYFLTEAGGALDILRWSVQGGGGEPGSWSRRYVVQGQPHASV